MFSEKSDKRDTNNENQFISQEKMREFGVADESESIFDVFERVSESIAEIERQYSDSESVSSFKLEILKAMRERKLIPNTAILMNAGRRADQPLSACTVPPVDLQGDLSKVKDFVDQVHFGGMGTGFSLDEVEDPVSVLEYLNQIGVSGLEDKYRRQIRPVGNMATISVHHPDLLDVIGLKAKKPDKKWVFNFSVTIDNKTLDDIKKHKKIKLGTQKLEADDLMDKIAKSVHSSGEPGIVFIDRLNEDNQVPGMGEYKSVAPCGEVGLLEGETCQFSYINLGALVDDNSVNYRELERMVRLSVRFLDDVVDYNIPRYNNETSKKVTLARRKIGVGVCGLADMLAKLNISYGTDRARKLAENVFSFINFISKDESVNLAIDRGAFGAFSKSKYTKDNGIILQYADKETETVSRDNWLALNRRIKEFGVRNCSTTSMPPTGRSSAIVKASPSIEPYFSEMLDISPEDQLMMISSVQKFTDESISKTINVPETTSADEIRHIIELAMDSNLKGITIYRDKTIKNQPVKYN